MKILTNYEDLVGKTIAFIHVAQFAEQLTIATTDQEVFMASFAYDEDTDNWEIRTYHEGRVLQAIQGSDYLQKELDKLGIFNLTEYRKQQEEEQKKRQERRRIEQEKKERELYEKLKAKYEQA